ncbi:MAG: YaiO family outer membrane beta-barrel protein [Nitrospinota bacterium]
MNKAFCLSFSFVAMLGLFSTAAYSETLAERKLPSPLEIEAGFTSEQLTNNYDDWSSNYLNLAKKLDKGKTLYGSLRETNRFNLKDSEAKLGYYHPLDKKWTVHLEGANSSTHRVLPKWTLFGGLIRGFAGGWVLDLGFRKTEYNNSRINLGVATLERYFGNFHAAYSFYQSNLEGNGSAQAHGFRLNYFYTDTSRVGAAFSTGSELEFLGPSLGVLRSDVTSISLSGRHAISPKWGVSYSYGYHEQGKSYIKRGFQVGIRYLF